MSDNEQKLASDLEERLLDTIMDFESGSGTSVTELVFAYKRREHGVPVFEVSSLQF